MISGRIDNFRGTDGVYLGADTVAMPTIRKAGGENDWVVLLNALVQRRESISRAHGRSHPVTASTL